MSLGKAEFLSLDVIQATNLTRRLLTIIGARPLIFKNSSGMEKWISMPLAIFWHGLLNFMIVSMMIHTFTREDDILMKLSVCGPISFFLTGELKFCAVIYRRKEIKQCIEYIESDWMKIKSQEYRHIMITNITTAKNLTYLCGFFMYTGGAFFNLVLPFVMGTLAAQKNITIRPLIYPGSDIFFNSQVSPTYEIIYCFQCLASWINFTISINACNLAAIFVTHACGQIQIMNSTMSAVINNGDKTDLNIHGQMSEIVRSHNNVLRYAKNIEKALKEICLVEVVLSTLGICFLEYYCLVTWNDSEPIGIFTYFVLWISLTFSIFIFCYIGELLREECTEVGKLTFMVSWYQRPKEISQILILVIAVAQHPPKITAGGIIELTLESFASLLKTSFAYLNMIRTVTM